LLTREGEDVEPGGSTGGQDRAAAPAPAARRVMIPSEVIGAHPDQVHLELGERGEDVEERRPHRVVGVLDLTAGRQRHPRLASSYRCHCLIEAGALALGAADAMVDVDAILRHAERVKRLALGCEVLLVSRASGISNQRFIHPGTVLRPVALINRQASEWVRLLRHPTNSSDWWKMRHAASDGRRTTGTSLSQGLRYQ
jgi:hypothetical protein